MAEHGEFSWGGGLMPPQGRGYVPTAYDRLVASRKTDAANPEASEDAILEGTATNSSTDSNDQYVPGDMRTGVVPMVTETGPAPSTGQHKPIDPAVYQKGHDPEGEQDGKGVEWRKSLPPNPKRFTFEG